MTIESEADIVALQRIGRIVSQVLHRMLDSIEPGMTTAELDAIGARMLAEFGARSAPQLAYDFPGATCISVNEQAAHGVPGGRIIKAGDLVNGNNRGQTTVSNLGKLILTNSISILNPFNTMLKIQPDDKAKDIECLKALAARPDMSSRNGDRLLEGQPCCLMATTGEIV